jgi:ribA/ribD-fused uncharacterized protein
MVGFWAKRDTEDALGENWWLSNFYPAPFTVHNITYKTSEHYFQAHKFKIHSDEFYQVVNAPDPGTAAKLGRSLPIFDGPEHWENQKDSVMWVALVKKFEQNPELIEKLKATGAEEIVECSPKDGYWGYGPDKQGKNQLGKLLMDLRDTYFK